jgi:hypothetical protein
MSESTTNSTPHTANSHVLDANVANEIPRELADLVEVIYTLPTEYRQLIEPALTKVVDSNRRRRRILTLVQDALSQLRLDMKYLTFDLEATRRERDELRVKLEGSGEL